MKKRPPIHPGSILKMELEEAGISASAAALSMRIPANRLTEIINGKRSISAETAMRLALFFGTSTLMWMNLQSSYEVQVAEDKLAKKVRKEVEPLARVVR
jgi:addiction module HigA family antidote